MKVITIGTLKGGTGKTATIFNLAGLLAERYRVLLIDVDPQTNLSLNCGIDVTANLKTVKDIFDDTANLDNIIVKAPIQGLPNIDVIPSNIALTVTELNLVSRDGRENVLNNFVMDNETVLIKYDYILIDTSPSMGIINKNAFLLADSIVLVTDVSLNGIQGAELFIEVWANARRHLRKADNVKALVLNNLDRRMKLSAELVEYCCENENTKNIVLNSVIPASVQVKNTEIGHLPINLLCPNSPIHDAYKALMQELEERGVF